MPNPQNVVGLNRQANIAFSQDEIAYNQPGGPLIIARAGEALRVGDAVYWDANGEVSKSTTAANYAAFAGIVVGGKATNMKVMLGTTTSNPALLDSAAAADQLVIVMAVGGIAWTAAAAAVVRGARVGVATTEGEVDDSVATYTIGVALDTATNAHDPIRIHLNGVAIEL